MSAHMAWISRFKKFNGQPHGSVMAGLRAFVFRIWGVHEMVKLCRQQNYEKRDS